MPWIDAPEQHRCQKPPFSEWRKKRQHQNHYWQCEECARVYRIYWFSTVKWRGGRVTSEHDTHKEWREVRMWNQKELG